MITLDFYFSTMVLIITIIFWFNSSKILLASTNLGVNSNQPDKVILSSATTNFGIPK